MTCADDADTRAVEELALPLLNQPDPREAKVIAAALTWIGNRVGRSARHAPARQAVPGLLSHQQTADLMTTRQK
ncbi:hypothetical protein [Streptomyces sp. NPDC005385]|uniref:hypothetical protein n=1 Tax=Streptomyces sp. NPDC005385 TaxID=3157039 RepID=UPI0033A90E4A